MSEDWLKRSFLIIGSFLSGCALLYAAYAWEAVVIPVQGSTITLGRVELIALAAVCLGVQTGFYKLQKKLIECFAKGIEG